MCGIVSLISRRPNGFYTADLSIFENMLVMDTLRGLDSTGVFCVDSNRNISFMKIASHPYHLFECDDWKKWRGKAVSNGRILVGHNRKATQGSINSANAHPFHENNIILVHNGTLRGDHKKIADTEVDSHALCHAFNEKGAENVIPTINGAFALMWWDIEKNSLFAIRNDERPLCIVVTDEVYACVSEAWMATCMLQRDHKKVIEVINIEPGTLYEFKIGGKYTTKEIDLNAPDIFHKSAVHQQVTPSPKPNGGNLVLVKSETPPANDTKKSETDVPLVSKDGHVPCEDFPVGTDVLVKFNEMRLSGNGGFYTLTGKTIEPGEPTIDVVSYLGKVRIADGDQYKYVNTPVLAKVYKHTVSTCGRSLFVNSVHIPQQLDLHNTKVTEHEWSYIMTHCKCELCSAPIYDEEQKFTSLSRRANNKYAVTCAECVEDTLTGAYKHEFNQNRLAAVQEYQREREESLVGTNYGLDPEGSSTLH